MNLNINSSNQVNCIVNVTEQFGDTPSLDNGASVTVTITNRYGVLLAGESWPVALNNVVGVDGLYSKTFSPLVNLVEGERYRVVFNVTTSGGLLDECTHDAIAIKKEC
ncbi:MAG TPA: hypothetical protein EYN67_19345 [Flavobacteriales bacterium]|nr:hypothetical protein [Methylococcaceae bacterium]HHZ97643.1 hypothetical protein [Flavobacteriales bacterium]